MTGHTLLYSRVETAQYVVSQHLYTLYRVIQPKSHNLAPTYFLYTWSNLKTLWHGKSQHVLI